MTFGMQITRDDGRIFASPEFTPSVLVQVMDVTADYTQDVSAVWYFQTIVPNSSLCLVFHKNKDGAVLYYTEVGPSGYWQIKTVGGSAGIVHRLRFYIFSNFVVNIPEWGVYFYKDNKIVYHGSCLPLDIKFWDIPQLTTPSPTTVPCAAMGGFARQLSQPLVGSNPPVITVFYFCFTANDSGPVTGIFRTYTSSSGSGGPDGFAKGCAYIETAIYDQYYKASLGYA